MKRFALVLVLVLLAMVLAISAQAEENEGIEVMPEAQTPVYLTQSIQQMLNVKADSDEEFEFLQEFAVFSGKGIMRCIELGAENNICTWPKITYLLATGELSAEEIPAGIEFDFWFLQEGTQCYELFDLSQISEEYVTKEVAGLKNQRYFVSSEGWFFCLPGFRKEMPDGTVRYLVNEIGQYYEEGEYLGS